MITLSGIWTILVLSLNIVLGYTGQVSMCHGSFFGIGAYASTLLVMKAGWSYWLVLPVAALLSAFVGFLIGIPALRSKGSYFAICTLGFGIIVTIILDNWIGLTGGPSGISNIPPPDSIVLPSLREIAFHSAASQYYLILVTIYFLLFFTRRLIDSRSGRAFLALRRDEVLAESIGINPMRYKLLAFTIGAFFAGVGGSFYSWFVGVITPAISSLYVSFEAIVFLVVGGAGTLMGPILGTLLLTVAPEFLQVIPEYRMVIYGVLLFLTIVFMPYGLMGGIRSLAVRWGKI
jgi:branched-chain amino acid transport system permease protein